MKKCNTCGMMNEENSNFCQSCGSTDFAESKAAEPAPEIAAEPAVLPKADGNGNIVAGIVGAFLFSLIGAALYFIVYQLGVIAGVCGLVTFILANFGYGLFAGTKNKNSIVGLISAIVMMLIMIFVAEYFCISYEIFQIYKDEGITIFDAVRATPDFLVEPELAKAVGSDLCFAYIFGIIASISNIINIIKSRKAK